MAHPHSLPFYVLASALLCSTASMAQNSSAAARITAYVDESSLTTLKGNVPHLARAEYDQGAAPASTQLTNVRLVLSRSAEQQAALDKYLAELQDKSSPNYHKWLTPAQFGALYGPADSDVAAITAWLESHGLTLETVSIGRTNIAFSGTVSQVEEAFHTSIHSFAANGQQFYSNTTDPKIPSALAAVVKGVAHLNTIKPKPQFMRGSAGKINPQTKRLERVNNESANGAKPNLTGGSGTSSDPYTLYIVPGDAATIYDTPNTTLNYCTTSSSCSSTAGSGYYSSTSDDGDEAYIDTELSGGLAPGASIYYYASTDLNTGIEAAIDANVVDIFSLSFGECEQDMSTSDNALINGWWEQAAGQGIAVTVSSGDTGSASCDGDASTSETVAVDGLSVSGFASTPYNIAVGGTDFYELPTEYSTYASTSEGSSSTYYRTAKGYTPESTWNDSTTNNTTISANVPLTGYYDNENEANIAAGSGGKSSCSTNTSVDNANGSVTDGTCTSGYSKPSWQTGTNVPQDGVRDLPDVSLMSGNGYDDAVWLVCDDATGTGETGATITTDCEKQSDGYSYYDAFGGTSTAAPAFAGILALVQQKTGSRLGQAAKELYQLYNGSYASSVFHDTTVGNISVPCTSGTPNCTKNSAGYYFESGYDTTTGYDLATGLGSVDVKQLLNYWNTVSGTATATVSETLSASSITNNQSVTASGTVVSGSSSITTTPTGTVTLSGGGYSASQQLSSGAYSFTIPANSLSAGTDTLTVTYSGDSNYASESTSKSLTVNVMTPTVAVSAPSSGNVANSLSVSITVTGPTGSTAVPSGTVSLSGGGYTSGATQLTVGSSSATATITIPANSLTAGSDKLTVTYSGDSNYASGTGTATVTITQSTTLTPTVKVTPSPSSVETGQSLNVTVAVSGTGATPTGTVTLTSGSTSLGSGTLSSGSITITVAANKLGVGTDTLTASYGGDSNYATGTGTATVTVTQSTYTLTPSPASGTVSPGSSTSFTITGSSTTNYTGTVTLNSNCTVSTTLTSYSYAPSCSVSPTTIVFSGGTVTSATAPTVTVSTTQSSSELVYPKMPGKGRGWTGAGGGAVLAFLVFLGIPSRRRSWRQMLGVLVLMAVLGGLAACGGGGGGTTGTSGTTAGTYTITVTGTGNDVDSTVETSSTFTLTVN